MLIYFFIELDEELLKIEERFSDEDWEVSSEFS
jgi:hypothetical protein